MRRRCGHPEWTVVGRTYTPPPPVGELNLGRVQAKGYGSAAAMARVASDYTAACERLLLGVTNVEQRCAVCGWTEVEQVSGRVGGVK